MPTGETPSYTQSSQSWSYGIVILACAISAGIQAALTPEHFREGAPAGVAFAASAAALAGLWVALTLYPGVIPLVAASVVLAVTSGLLVLRSEPEPVEGLAVEPRPKGTFA